jgi:diadenylate cyclase
MELFKIGFLSIRLVDLLDVSIVTYLFYKLYQIIRGSVATRVVGAIAVIFLLWKVVDVLDMPLLKSILDQFLAVGAIGLIVVFAPEIRRVLLILVKNTFLDRISRQLRLGGSVADYSVDKIVSAVEHLKNAHVGALIVLTGNDSLEQIRATGDKIDSEVSERMIHSIFLPYSPLHDGAVIIDQNRIAAARCVLPLTDNNRLSAELGLRHRSAMGLSEVSDALVIAVSEERNEVSVALGGKLTRNVDAFSLEKMVLRHYGLTYSGERR